MAARRPAGFWAHARPLVSQFQTAEAKCKIKPVKIMLPRLAIFLLAAVCFALVSAGFTQPAAQSNQTQSNKQQDNNAQQQTPRQSKAVSGSDVARGKYIVEGVAMCGQCHTPRDSNGNPDRTRWLQGAPVPWQPATPDQKWPLNAPRIGGTPPASDADMVKLLTTGIWTNGSPLRSPMPQFRMDQSDAEAVVAYLKSLTPQQ
jgi:mono/diheme cytochrome c family protein